MIGIFCGFFSLLICHPFDTIKTRMCLDFTKNKSDRLFRSILSTISITRETQGFLSLYSGFLLANLINFPYFLSIYCALYIVKNANSIKNDQVKIYLGNLGIGALFAHLVTYPLDTLK